jgi:SAM-dependent methyltransferase
MRQCCLPALLPVALIAGIASVTPFASGASPEAGEGQDVARGSSIHSRNAKQNSEAPPRVRPVSWTEAKPIVERLADALPATLRDFDASERRKRWDSWVRGQRQAIAARIARGEEDSLVNLLLFGTSFTAEPRITSTLLTDLDRRWSAGDSSAQQTLLRAYRQRAVDLVSALAAPGASERMRFGRRMLERRGHALETAAGRRAATEYLLSNVVRVRKEAAALAMTLETVRASPDSTTAFAERSRLFRERGLAPDSSVLTQFAVDRALCALAEHKTILARSVTRAAVVGPGLDFADKQEGFDFYPVQTLQPFTAIDSLLRCGLAPPEGLRVTTIDVSPRVNSHLRAAGDRAKRSRDPYRLVLPWDPGSMWLADAGGYWRQAGDQIGTPFSVPAPPALPDVQARGVLVPAEIVDRLRVVEANIVLDRLDLPDTARFDLVVATNVLIYYDTFEQTLALAGIAALLRPGAVLITNDAVLEVPEVPLRSAGYITVRFSEREGDGEHMVWYQRRDDLPSR